MAKGNTSVTATCSQLTTRKPCLRNQPLPGPYCHADAINGDRTAHENGIPSWSTYAIFLKMYLLILFKGTILFIHLFAMLS